MQGNSLTISRESKIKKSVRVQQASSMFDLPVEEKNKVEWTVNLPALDEDDWSVGLIVGPSGSGKTTIATELFGDKIVSQFNWDRAQCILDDFPADMSIKEITKILGSVGFSSPPNWLRPFEVLSNGEKFRAFIARAIAESGKDMIVIDEFTSVIDREVAKVACHSVQKAIRRRESKIVCLSCHYDIIDWLNPDWIYQPYGDEYQRRCLRRHPSVNIQIHPVSREIWKMFAQFHYLSDFLHPAAQCFGAFLDEKCIAFVSYRYFPHPKCKNIMKGHRLVVHPDYQGLGIGGVLANWRGQYLYEMGYRNRNTTAHPALVSFYKKSPRWKLQEQGLMTPGSKKIKKSAPPEEKALRKHFHEFTSSRRSFCFEYRPPANS